MSDTYAVLITPKSHPGAQAIQDAPSWFIVKMPSPKQAAEAAYEQSGLDVPGEAKVFELEGTYSVSKKTVIEAMPLSC